MRIPKLRSRCRRIGEFLHVLALAAAVLAACRCWNAAIAADWPQWQGPDRNAMSKENGLLQEWPAEGPPLAWRIKDLGGGDSAPSISGGRIFGMSNRGDREVVWALSEKDGKEVWATPLGPAVQQRMPQSKEGPACTPTVDGDRLYVLGMGGRLACLKVKNGEIIWQHSLTEDFGGVVPMWSYRESPLVDGDRVICTPGGPDALIVALDKLTGKTVWKSKMPSATAGADSGAGSAAAAVGTVVAGTKEPGLFTSEHWGMSAFSSKVPNGKYLAKLYFAETYEGITAAGQRVFSFKVQGHEFKDFDIFAKAGGAKRAYIETVPVEVTNGEFRIDFTPKVENPAICAIEIIPQSEPKKDAESAAAAIRINAGASAPFTDSKGQVWQPDKGFEGGRTSQLADGSGGGAGGFGRAPGGSGGGRGGFGPGGFGGFGGAGGAGAAYASVIPIDFDGQRQYVQLTAQALVGVAASDGKFLWRYKAPANGMAINCSTPLYHDGMLFAASAYGAGGGLVKLTKDDSGTIVPKELYSTKRMQNHHGGMIVVDDSLYGANGGNGGGALLCLDFKTGEVLWDLRGKHQADKGSVAFADGRLYYRLEDGTMLLIEPNREKYVERGRFEQPDRSKSPAWAHPVIANGKLYLRDQDLLLCYDIKAT
jgi:alcohol dehydrogenase (cytochrome c)